MPYQPTTNFKDNYGADLGEKLITQDYLSTVYSNLGSSINAFITYPSEIYSWGSNAFGNIGDNTSDPRSTPRQEFTIKTNWTKISAGQDHMLAIASDGSLWSWGRNNYGQLGDNTQLTFRSTPRQISIAAAGGLTGWKEISAGIQHSSAIRTNGTLWIWGSNIYGELGENTAGLTIGRSTPRQISIAAAGGLGGWYKISAGYNFTVSIRSDGTLWAWGRNTFGQLGDNTNANRSTPRQISIAAAGGLTGWKEIFGSNGFAKGLRTDGTLWSWGANASGQLGINDNSSRSTPVQEFTSSTNWRFIASCLTAIKTDGTLWSWGTNSFGQLGVNDTITRSTPTQEFTSSTNWVKSSSSIYNSAAIKSDGTLWMWGNNQYGTVGDNTSTVNNHRSTPRQEFTSSTCWVNVSVGTLFVSAIEFDSR